MLLNTLDASLGPRCIGGVLESLGTRPPRPIPHRDREDTLDLAEGTTPWLPGNEHLILQSSVCSPSVYLGVKHHAPVSSSSGKSQCSSTDHTLHAGFSRVALHPTTRRSPPFGQKTCLAHLCSPEPCTGKKCGLKKSLLKKKKVSANKRVASGIPGPARWVRQEVGRADPAAGQSVLCASPRMASCPQRDPGGLVPTSQWPQVPSNPEPSPPDQPRVYLSLRTATSYRKSQ